MKMELWLYIVCAEAEAHCHVIACAFPYWCKWGGQFTGEKGGKKERERQTDRQRGGGGAWKHLQIIRIPL